MAYDKHFLNLRENEFQWLLHNYYFILYHFYNYFIYEKTVFYED